jgi:hypothetical protein
VTIDDAAAAEYPGVVVVTALGLGDAVGALVGVAVGRSVAVGDDVGSAVGLGVGSAVATGVVVGVEVASAKAGAETPIRLMAMTAEIAATDFTTRRRVHKDRVVRIG